MTAQDSRPVHRTLQDMKWSCRTIEYAKMPKTRMGSEIAFESKRRVAALIRRLYREQDIEGVVVNCPEDTSHILVRIPVTIRGSHSRGRFESVNMWKERTRLYEKLDKMVRAAYPFIQMTGYEIRYGTWEEWQAIKWHKARATRIEWEG